MMVVTVNRMLSWWWSLSTGCCHDGGHCGQVLLYVELYNLRMWTNAVYISHIASTHPHGSVTPTVSRCHYELPVQPATVLFDHRPTVSTYSHCTVQRQLPGTDADMVSSWFQYRTPPHSPGPSHALTHPHWPTPTKSNTVSDSQGKYSAWCTQHSHTIPFMVQSTLK